MLTENNEIRYLLFGGGAEGGKAQPLNRDVVTPFGKKKMGDIQVGDLVAHPSGTFSTVIAIHPQGQKKVYRIDFSDGSQTECCGDHLWFFTNNRCRKFETRIGQKGKVATTEQLKEKINTQRIHTPICEPVQFNTAPHWRNQKIDPYILGALIGDGGLTKSVVITVADTQIIKEIKRGLIPPQRIVKNKQQYAYRIITKERNKNGSSKNSLIDHLRELGLMGKKSEHKFIPKKYFTAPLDVRYAIVQGLMDTDGTVSKTGKVRFSTSSKQLAHDMRELLISLGCRVTINPKPTTHLISYRLCINSRDNKKLFRLSRKKERCKPYDQNAYGLHRTITSIEPIGKKECKCITVSAPDGLYVTDDYIVTHNSWLGWFWLTCMCLKAPNTRWFCGREELKRLRTTTLKTFFKMCKMYGIENYKYNAQDYYIEFENGSTIELLELSQKPSDPLFERLGSSEFTGGWIEEAGEVPFGAFDVLKARIGRHLNGKYGIDGKILLTCNPSKNWLYETFYLPTKTGEIDKRYKFIKSLYDDNPFREADAEKRLNDLADETQKRRLKYGDWEFSSDPAALVSFKDLIACTKVEAEEGKKYIGADIARMGDDSTVFAMFNGNALTELFKQKDTDTIHTAKDLKSFAVSRFVPAENVGIDTVGLGAGVYDYLKEIRFTTKEIISGSTPTKDYKGYTFNNLRSQMWWAFRESVLNKEIRIDIDDQQMMTELTSLRYEIRNDKEIKVEPKKNLKKRLGHSPDRADAVVYANAMRKQIVGTNEFFVV